MLLRVILLFLSTIVAFGASAGSYLPYKILIAAAGQGVVGKRTQSAQLIGRTAFMSEKTLLPIFTRK